MKEDLLHYLWQYQEFNKEQLTTSQSESVQIISNGYHNVNAGPDFLNTRIKIANVIWSGAVEIHVKSSEWFRHHHHLDPVYDNVVLHVVWEHDKEALRSDGTAIPTLELKRSVDLSVIKRYHLFFKQSYEQGKGILCKKQRSGLDSFTTLSMIERALIQRIEAKAQEVLLLLEKNLGDWSATFYQHLMKAFGFKVNADPFMALSKAVPYGVMLKLGEALTAFEALLLGQAGFLEQRFQHHYLVHLQEEYRFLEKKFRLNDKVPLKLWKFSRLRPANFPTLRIAQVAMFLCQWGHQLHVLIEENDVEVLIKRLSVRQSAYWQTHYLPERPAKTLLEGIGKESVDKLIINGVIPVKYAFAKFYQHEGMAESVLDLLQKLSAENNTITRQYKAAGFPVQSAFDSQAVIELYHKYCSQHRCLDCKIGVAVMKNAAKPVSSSKFSGNIG